MRHAWISLLLLPFACFAQEPASQPARGAETKLEDRGAIAGLVLNATSGEPVGKAILILRRVESIAGRGLPSFTVTTDSEGKFSFTDIEAGNYRLTATRTGYVNGAYGSRGPMRPGATLSLVRGQKITDLRIRLTPHAVITGRVVDDDREPMASVWVQALRYRYVQGRKQFVPAGGVATNDLGEFRIFGLEPGRFFLNAAVPRIRLPDQPDPTSQGPEETYAPTFYPNGRNAADAIPVEVSPGSQIAGIDFRLTKTSTLRVKGRINNATGTAAPISVSLIPNEQIATSDGNSGSANGPRGEFEIRGVTPGSYTLGARIIVEGGKMLTARQPVEVGLTNVENVNLTIRPGVEIRGQIRVEDESPAALAALRVDLLTRTGSIGAAGSVTDQGAFTMRSVNPDHYFVNISRMPDGFYAKAIRVGQEAYDIKTIGIDLTKGPTGQFDVILSPKAGQISGTATDEKSKPASAVTVVLIPQEKELRELAHFYKTVVTDQSGRFTLKNLDPGEYKLFAWEEVEPGAYMDPEFVKPVESRGTAVTVRESSREDLQVRIIPAE